MKIKQMKTDPGEQRWNREMLREVTRKGWITEAERKAITEEKE